MLNIPRDKILHFYAGLAISGVASVVWIAASQCGLVDMGSAWFAAILASGTAGVVKEKCDYEDNKIYPGMHGVELMDALATLAGSFPTAALLLWLAR